MASTSRDPDLECPICHGLFTSPKILPCYHLACRDCVISWLKKGGQGGCPLCRAPILSPTHTGQGHLDSLVDAIPTDLFIESLVKGHLVLTEPNICAVCPNNTAATYYCIDCEDKLCATCLKNHKRVRGIRNHNLQDINTITAQDLSANFQSPCQNHADRTAEVYCCSHRDLICGLCATTNHRSCPEVKVLADVANERRRELGQLVQTQRTKEAAMVRQFHFQSRKHTYDQQRREVTIVFDDLEQDLKQDLKTRRHELLDAIKKAEDSDEELENARAMLASHTVTMERLLGSRSNSVVVQMADQLEPRSRDVERRCGHADNVKAVQTVQLDQQRIDDIKSLLSALGVPATTSTTHTPPAVATTPTTPHTTPAVSTTPHTTPAVSTTSSPAGSVAMASATAASASIPTTSTTRTTSITRTTRNPRNARTTRKTSTTPTTPKPTGAALARVLKVGDRVRLSDTGRRSRRSIFGVSAESGAGKRGKDEAGERSKTTGTKKQQAAGSRKEEESESGDSQSTSRGAGGRQNMKGAARCTSTAARNIRLAALIRVMKRVPTARPTEESEETLINAGESTRIIPPPSSQLPLNVCQRCCAAFELFNSFKLHMAFCHGDKLQAVKPDRETDKGEGRQKMERDSRRHVCDVCSKAFILAGHLKRHKLIHTGRKQFVCDVCSKTFTQAGHLKRHKLIHT